MNESFRLLLTGSRNVERGALWLPVIDDVPEHLLIAADREPHTLDAILDQAARIAARSGFPSLTLMHGACPKGVDAVGDRWARRRRANRWPVVVEPHPADWAGEGRGAGFVRNTAMVRCGAHVCFALIAPCVKPGCRKPKPHGSHGASQCAELADGGGIQTQRFEPAPVPARNAGSPLPNPERR